MFVRSAYNYDSDVESFRSGLACEAPSLAQQHMRDETDINVMVQRFQRTGIPPAPEAPSLAEFDGVFDFQSAMNVIVQGREAFSQLPARVRSRFGNDPGEFLSFIHDDSNRLEAEALGLVPKAPLEPSGAPVEPSEPAVSGESAHGST